jgi:hypothetical protein
MKEDGGRPTLRRQCSCVSKEQGSREGGRGAGIVGMDIRCGAGMDPASKKTHALSLVAEISRPCLPNDSRGREETWDSCVHCRCKVPAWLADHPPFHSCASHAHVQSERSGKHRTTLHLSHGLKAGREPWMEQGQADSKAVLLISAGTPNAECLHQSSVGSS